MEEFVNPCKENEKPRKKPIKKENWKRTQAKKSRYKPKCFPEFPQCNHKEKSLKCKLLSPQDIRKFHSNFYKESNKIYQDNYILKFLVSTPIKRRRPKNNRNVAQQTRAKYFIPNHAHEHIPVCLNTFLGCLKISRFRVNRLTKRFQTVGEMPKERRGGDRIGDKNNIKIQQIMSFINSFKCSQTHYCINPTGRKYLPSELNIKKMWRMYNNKNEDVRSTESFFRKIFNTKYNLGFGTPRVDVCSTCLELNERLSSAKEEKEKEILKTQKRVHQLRYKAFYELLKDQNPKMLILSFDCQKNQPLPKLPDQATYYSRQLYLNNFTIVKGHSKSSLNPNNVSAYVWLENEFPKGANEIASCVYDTLINMDMAGYTIVRLICDGCGGQNKNTILITMLCYWYKCKAPKNIEEIQVVFPVTGHSFLPPDRVFGNIEKQIRKIEVIYHPNQYMDLIEQHATVKRLGTDSQDLNWKELRNSSVKSPPQWHFAIKLTKRVFITKQNGKVYVQGEQVYRSKLNAPKLITKANKNLCARMPQLIQKGNKLQVKKKENIDSLLKKHYGENWRMTEEKLSMYKQILDNFELTENEEQEEVNDHFCERVEEAPTLIV